MKRKWMIALVAAMILTLTLAGCTLGTTEENGNAYNGGNGNSSSAYNGENGNGDSVAATGSANGTAEAVETGTGYRGNNSNAQGGRGETASEDCTEDETCTPANEAAENASSSYTVTSEDQALSLEGYGSEGALADDDLTLADMLTYAIQDEYLARAEYELIIGEYGSVSPFTNIMKAEETHISTLLPLFETYGITAPADEGADHAVSVSSLTAAYEAGVTAEINNIAMYETFLEQDLPSDVAQVFTSLMHASENHLRAFQNHL